MNARYNFPAVLGMGMLVLTFASCASQNDKTVAAPVNQRVSNNSQNMNRSNAKDVEVKSDIEELKKQINLPVRPIEVMWTAETMDNSQGTVPGPTDYRLTALLTYDEKGAQELVQKLAAGTKEKSLGNVDVSLWFPEEVKRQAKTIDQRSLLEGAKYEPDLFLQAPYSDGKIVRIGNTNYFVLNLFSF